MTTLKGAKASLDRITRSLASTQGDREFLLKNTRSVVSMCSRSIVSVHGGDTGRARSELREAGALLAKYRKRAPGDLKRYLVVPEQEFVEASALIAVAEKRQIPSREALRVSEEAYVLGLLDCIGELKRFVLDRIRAGRMDDALAVFDTMQDLFSLLYPFAGLDKVLKESRRKVDVGRMVVEDVRAVITQEVRRRDLIRAITEAVEAGKKGRARR